MPLHTLKCEIKGNGQNPERKFACGEISSPAAAAGGPASIFPPQSVLPLIFADFAFSRASPRRRRSGSPRPAPSAGGERWGRGRPAQAQEGGGAGVFAGAGDPGGSKVQPKFYKT